jgi:hypothetical protein
MTRVGSSGGRIGSHRAVAILLPSRTVDGPPNHLAAGSGHTARTAMTADVLRRSFRQSAMAAAGTLLAVLALAAIAGFVSACSPPRDVGAPTPGPTMASIRIRA